MFTFKVPGNASWASRIKLSKFQQSQWDDLQRTVSAETGLNSPNILGMMEAQQRMEFLGKHITNRKKTEGRKQGGFIFTEKFSVEVKG